MGTVRGNGVGKQGLRIAQYYPYLHPAGSAKADEYKHVILEQGQWALVWSSTTQCCLYVHDEATPGGFKIACTSVPDPITVRSFEFDEETNILTLEMTDDSVWPVDLSSLVSASSTIDNIERDGVVMTVTMTDGTEHTVNFAGMTEVVNNGDGTFSFLEAGVVKASWAAGAGGVDLSDYLKRGDIILTLLPTGWFELRVKGELIGTWTQGDKISADGAGQYTATKPDGSTITWFGLQEKTIASVVANPDGSDTVTITNPDLSKVVFTIPVVPAVPDVPEGIENLGMSIDLATGIVTFTNRDGSTISFRGTDEDSITLISVDTVARTITARNPDGSEVVFMYFDPANPPFYAHDESLLGDGTDADPLRVNWVRICTDLANGDGLYDGGDLIACTPAGARKVSRKVLIDDPVDEKLDEGRYAFYENPDDMRDIGINDMPAGGVVAPFPTTLEQELASVFTGGNVDGALPNYVGEEFGHVLFMPLNEERTNYIAAETPWKTHRGRTRRMIPLDIRTQIPGLSFARPLFKPTLTNLFGMLAFRYVGEEPLHTTLEGSFSAFIKTSLQPDSSYMRSTLTLECYDPPAIAAGQGGGRQNLSVSATGVSAPDKFVDTLEFQDIGIPAGQVLIANASTWPDWWGNGSGAQLDVTFSAATDHAADAVDPYPRKPFSVGSVVAGAMVGIVSDWIDITQGSAPGPRDVAYVLWFQDAVNTAGLGGFGTYGRVRYKIADGTIKYLPQQSSERAAFRAYYLPRDAVAVQLAFDVAKPDVLSENSLRENLMFARTGNGHAAESMPLHGSFVEASFDVMSDVVFYPGCEYALAFNNSVYDGGFNRGNGFRFQGGGFKATFPAGKMKKELARAFFERSN